MVAALTADGLTKSFGGVPAVQDLTLNVNEGEMFGLVGPDGAGKTTTIRLLCGILLPTSGSASVLGLDIARDADRIKRQIGYLSQRFTLYGDLTVDENIQFFAEINGVHDFMRRREELLEFTRLTPFRRRLAEQLSGGMKQKLALACTLIHTPRLLFLDEPTTGVDPVSRRDFWRILQALLADGITIVMTTPYLDEAERCSRVALVNAGRLMKVDTPEVLKASMEGEIVEIVCGLSRRAFALLKGGPPAREVQLFGDRLHVIVRDARTERPALERALRDAGVTIASSRIVSPSLENVFISLLTGTPKNEGAV